MTRVWTGEWVNRPDGFVSHRRKDGTPVHARCGKYLRLPSGDVTTCPRFAVWQRETVDNVAGLDFRHYDNRCDWHPPKGATA